MTEQFSSMERDRFHVPYLSDKIPAAAFHGQAVKTVAYLRVSTAQQDLRSQRLQFRAVALDPAPNCRMLRLQTSFAEQLFDIAERERLPQVPAHGAKSQLGLGLSPFEDRRSDCLLHDLFSLPAAFDQS